MLFSRRTMLSLSLFLPSRRPLLPSSSRFHSIPLSLSFFPRGRRRVFFFSSFSRSRFTAPPLARTGLRAATKLACRRSREHPFYPGRPRYRSSRRDRRRSSNYRRLIPSCCGRIHSPRRTKISRCDGRDGSTDETTTQLASSTNSQLLARGDSHVACRTTHVLSARSRSNWLDPLSLLLRVRHESSSVKSTSL